MQRSKRRRQPWVGLAAFAALLCMVLAAEWSAHRMYWLTPGRDAAQTELMQAKHAAVYGPAYDVLFLGDSTAGSDVAPALFTEITGLTAYSMHTNADVGATSGLYLLTEYLARHPAPQAVVVLQSFHGWSAPQRHDVLLEHFMRPDIAWTLWQNGLAAPEEFAEAAAGWLLPSVRYRRHILRLRPDGGLWDGILGKGEGQFADPLLGHVPIDRVITRMDVFEGEMDSAAGALRGAIGKPDAGLSAEALLMAGELCRIGKEHGVETLFLIPPMPADVLSQTGATPGLRAMESAIRQRVAGCRTAESHPLPSDVFGDGIHMNATGAALFTRELAELLGQTRR